MDSTNTISSVLKSIYKRPGMYFMHHDNFKNYATYIEGFLCGIGLIHDSAYSRNLSRAFAEKYNGGTGGNIALEHLVGGIAYEHETDAVKIEKYMSFLIEYFESNDRVL